MKTMRERLLKSDIARAKRRRHRPCARHGTRNVGVCLACAKTFCWQCSAACPRCNVEFGKRELPKRQYKKLKPLRVNNVQQMEPEHVLPELMPVYERLKPLGMLRLDPHEDSGGWVAVFPYPLPGISTSTSLASKMFLALGPLAVPTPFGHGRWVSPEAWYVTFDLPHDEVAERG